jgi:hypothetical protein
MEDTGVSYVEVEHKVLDRMSFNKSNLGMFSEVIMILLVYGVLRPILRRFKKELKK